jgi:hypothetical protein
LHIVTDVVIVIEALLALVLQLPLLKQPAPGLTTLLTTQQMLLTQVG